MLQSRGHRVELLEADNDCIVGLAAKARASFESVYSRPARARVTEAVTRFRPDVVHVHNAFPRLSPSVYYACRDAGVPVVQTLHNYRLLCPGALLMRDGRVCEDCLRRVVPLEGVRHGCYRQSRVATAAVATMIAAHRALGTWRRQVDCYIALTEFARDKFVAGGFPPAKMAVKPNFLDPDPGPGNGCRSYALFVGRLSAEKGIHVLLRGWTALHDPLKLKIAGAGPLEAEVREHAAGDSRIQVLGPQPKSAIIGLMREAAVLIFPSSCYEGFPIVLAEAFATGTPVIASNLGAMAEIVEDGRTGLHFRPGDAADLAARVEWALTHPQELARMRLAVRAEYEAKYTADRNYQMVMEIYERVIRARRHTAST
jgi:glycosyltransferase involved in cell wall biosynthesis